MFRKTLLILALIVVLFSCISCQTVEGLGGDIEWLGNKTAEAIGSLE
ncbi:MAG: entericidin A/B family lipoprotein [Planctomycetota bacterium]|jgi:predicted small secreted protein